jgi:uncharacterized membrane protein YphA (DoxX/SURF4 family)
MKIAVNIARVLVGFLFIFSGLVKANDPLGLAFKMQEFFDVWAQNASLTNMMHWLDNYALPFSIIMITLEIIVGIGILLGACKRFFAWSLLLLIIFFSFLTGYAVLSGKIATCGCFGDCIPLTAAQSFTKDLILFALILFILFGIKYIRVLWRPLENLVILFISIVIILGFQWYVLKHMPLLDCLPFKRGNNLVELRKMPADAIPDKKDFKFFYKKDGKEKEFTGKNLPDSTWEFVRREDFIVEKGKNNEPPVKDFYLTTISGNDSTDAVLNTPGPYCLFFVKDFKGDTSKWATKFISIYNMTKDKNISIFIITSEATEAQKFFNEQHKYNVPILSLDATALKTAARTNPELYLMKGPVIDNKWGRADLGDAVR